MNLILIGYRCTGKTTVGQLLAEKLGWPLVDTDTLVQQRAGQTIEQIVAAGGWEAFRDAETAVVKDVAAGRNQVISLGGGAVLREENRQVLKTGDNRVVLLRAEPETVWQRMQGDAKTAAERPNLTGQGGLEEIRQLIADRRDVYQKTADFAISTDRYEPAEIAGRILAWLKLQRAV